MVAISGPSLNAAFEYDALSRRIEKTVNGVTTTFVYDGWDIIQETVIGGPTTNYTRTLNIDEPFAFERTDGTIRYYVQDALGSVIALTDAEGLVTTTYNYDTFGSVTINGTDDQPFQYTGRENDGTGLYCYRFRYYDPTMRRFISEDPIGLWGGINYYSYVGYSPLNWIDPYGLEPCDNPPGYYPPWKPRWRDPNNYDSDLDWLIDLRDAVQDVIRRKEQDSNNPPDWWTSKERNYWDQKILDYYDYLDMLNMYIDEANPLLF